MGRAAVERVLLTAGPNCGIGGKYDSSEGAREFLSEHRAAKIRQLAVNLVAV